MKSKKGVPRFRCGCGYLFLLWRGRKKNPKVIEVDEWLLVARCPNCGIKVNAHRRDDRGYRRSIC